MKAVWLAGLAAIVLAGCTPEAADTADGVALASLAAQTPDTTFTPSPASSAAASPLGESLSTIDEFAAAADRLLESRSYRFDLAVQGSGSAQVDLPSDGLLSISGVLVRDPEPMVHYTVTNLPEYPGRAISYVVIGETAWCDNGVGFFEELPPDLVAVVQGDLESMVPEQMFAYTFLNESLDLATVEEELVDGRAALHYSVTNVDALPLPGWWLDMDGEVQSFDLWLTRDGSVPMKAVVEGEIFTGDDPSGAFSMTLEVSGIDDPANVVEPPV